MLMVDTKLLEILVQASPEPFGLAPRAHRRQQLDTKNKRQSENNTNTFVRMNPSWYMTSLCQYFICLLHRRPDLVGF